MAKTFTWAVNMNKSTDQNFPSYEKVSQLLKSSHAVASTSEFHGLLCGLMCSGKNMLIDSIKWAQSVMAEVEGELPNNQEQLETLVNLFEITREKIASMDFDFQMLLPCDDAELKIRAKELGYWCQGFVAGLGLGGLQWEGKIESDVQDALYTISDIAQIDYLNLDITEKDEVAYIEVSEYVRLAVLSIYADITGTKKRSMIEATETIH